MLEHFVAVYVDKLLRNAGQEGSGEAADFRPFAGRVQKKAHIFGQELNIAARTVFQNECEPAGGPDARNSWRGKTESNSRRQFAQLLVQMRFDGLKLLGSLLRSSQGLKVTKKNAL